MYEVWQEEERGVKADRREKREGLKKGRRTRRGSMQARKMERQSKTEGDTYGETELGRA